MRSCRFADGCLGVMCVLRYLPVRFSIYRVASLSLKPLKLSPIRKSFLNSNSTPWQYLLFSRPFSITSVESYSFTETSSPGLTSESWYQIINYIDNGCYSTMHITWPTAWPYLIRYPACVLLDRLIIFIIIHIIRYHSLLRDNGSI